jgi:hypothetical protein
MKRSTARLKYSASVRNAFTSPIVITGGFEATPVNIESSLIKIKGRPAQYIVNLTDDPSTLLVTLINNGEAPWEGTVKIKGQKIESCLEWLSSGETCIRKGKLHAALPPTDVRIYELTSEEPFLEFA